MLLTCCSTKKNPINQSALANAPRRPLNVTRKKTIRCASNGRKKERVDSDAEQGPGNKGFVFGRANSRRANFQKLLEEGYAVDPEAWNAPQSEPQVFTSAFSYGAFHGATPFAKPNDIVIVAGPRPMTSFSNVRYGYQQGGSLPPFSIPSANDLGFGAESGSNRLIDIDKIWDVPRKLTSRQPDSGKIQWVAKEGDLVSNGTILFNLVRGNGTKIKFPCHLQDSAKYYLSKRLLKNNSYVSNIGPQTKLAILTKEEPRSR